MSIHSSLRSSKGSMGAARNVLKRHERIRYLLEHGLWVDNHSVLGLPKIKQTKIKARKAVAKEKEAAAADQPAASSSGSPA